MSGSIDSKLRPLAVDLDGTLFKGDLMQEAAAAFTAQNPLNLFRLLRWLCGGRAHLKTQLARNAPPFTAAQAAHLPYNAEFLAYLKQQKRQNRTLVLATAAHRAHAEAVAKHLGLFDRILASDGAVNLKGKHKAAALVRDYGEGQFDYAGDSRSDLAVWKHAGQAIVVNAPLPAALARAKRGSETLQFDAPPRGRDGGARDFLKALRPHQWTKNFLLFAAIAGDHQVLSAQALPLALIAFFAFNFLSSATYLINDILDLPRDRRHQTKRRRPLAAGRIGIGGALAAALACYGGGALLALALPPAFAAVAALYVAGTFAYSFWLKRLLFADVLTLSLLFTLRIIAGGAATSIALSFWLLAFSVFIFLSLAILKRYAELIKTPEDGRAYQNSDTALMAMLGTALGMMSVFVLALFIDSDAVSVRYSQPQYIWPAVPLMLYWLARIWLLGGRGLVGSDPLLFAVRDRISWVTGALILLLLILAK